MLFLVFQETSDYPNSTNHLVRDGRDIGQLAQTT